jgi:hypothetical protein
MSSILEKYGSFVKEQIDHNDRSAAKFRADEKRAQAYMQRAATFRQLLTDMEQEQVQVPVTPAVEPFSEANFRLSQEEIQDLPQELLEQLSLTESDKKEFLLAQIIDDLGGATSLDKLLIAIFRRTGEVEKRTRLNSRLYRMANKGMIHAHPTRKGIYGNKPFPAESGQAALFDSEEDLESQEDDPAE